MTLRFLELAIQNLMPEAVALIALCILAVVVWNISRVVTIRHYLKHHMDNMVVSEIKEKTAYIKMLEEENIKMQDELHSKRITLKIIRNALME